MATEDVGYKGTNADWRTFSAYIYYYQVTTNSSIVLDSYSVYCGGTASGTGTFVLYTDNGSNKPGSLIANTQSAGVTLTTNAWKSAAVTGGATLAAATKYWICIKGTADVKCARIAVGSGYLVGYQNVTSFPSTATTVSEATTGEGIYLTGTVVVASACPINLLKTRILNKGVMH